MRSGSFRLVVAVGGLGRAGALPSSLLAMTKCQGWEFTDEGAWRSRVSKLAKVTARYLAAAHRRPGGLAGGRGWSWCGFPLRDQKPSRTIFAARLAGFEQGVGARGWSRDRAEVFPDGGLDHAGIDQRRDFVEQVVLGDHVRGLEQRTVNMNSQCTETLLAASSRNRSSGALGSSIMARRPGCNDLDDLREVRFGVVEAGHVGHAFSRPIRPEFIGQRQAVVYHADARRDPSPRSLVSRSRGSTDHDCGGQPAQAGGMEPTPPAAIN